MLDSKHEMIKIREIKFEKRRFLQFVSSQILAVNHQSNVNHSSTVIRSSFGPKKKVLKIPTGQATPANVQGVSNQIYKQSETHSKMVNGWERLKKTV